MSEPLTNTEIGVLPFVSVIIPTYNRQDSLLRTLDSLARQIYPADRGGLGARAREFQH